MPSGVNSAATTGPDAARMVRLLNRLYQKEHMHKVGEKGWTVEKHQKWRQQYAPGILADIRELLDKILAKPDLLPKSDLASAAGYLDMEWDAVVDIFKLGDANLDNRSTFGRFACKEPRREDEPQFLHVKKKLALLRIALRCRACCRAQYAGTVCKDESHQLL